MVSFTVTSELNRNVQRFVASGGVAARRVRQNIRRQPSHTHWPGKTVPATGRRALLHEFINASKAASRLRRKFKDRPGRTAASTLALEFFQISACGFQAQSKVCR